jgi:poly-gamma-glutamate capsule biosynthesis protein CapA/YwtB (metallophosphatase superfamily)
METQTTRGLTIGLCGEVVLDAGVTRGVDVFGIDHPLGAVAPLLREADARLCDLAGAPGAHPSGVEVIRRAGFEAVSVANDHALDRGTGGLVETLAALDAAGVGHGGAGADLAAAERPVRLLRSGWRLSVLTFATHPAAWAAGPTTPGIRYVPLDTPGRARACAAVAAERGEADLLIVSLHAGQPFQDGPSPALRVFARALVEAGADVVWGHGARVTQGVEWFRGRPVLYDTGSLLDESGVDPALRNDLAGVFLVRARPGAIDAVDVRPTRIRGGRAEPSEGLERERWLHRLAERCRALGTRAGVGEGRMRLLAPLEEPVA